MSNKITQGYPVLQYVQLVIPFSYFINLKLNINLLVEFTSTPSPFLWTYTELPNNLKTAFKRSYNQPAKRLL